MEKTDDIPLEGLTSTSHPPSDGQTVNKIETAPNGAKPQQTSASNGTKSTQNSASSSAKPDRTQQIYGSQNYLSSSSVNLNVPRSVYGSQGYVASSSGQISSTQLLYGSQHSLARNIALNTPYGQSSGIKTAAPPSGQQSVIVKQTVIEPEAPPIPPDYLWLSCSVLWCCFPPAGLIAFFLSMASSRASGESRLEDAKRYSRLSLVTNIVGIVLAVIASIVISAIYINILV